MASCRFGDGEAIGRFRLDQGCLVYPDDREQDLCWYHARESTPLGSFEILADYTLPGGLRLADALLFLFCAWILS